MTVASAIERVAELLSLEYCGVCEDELAPDTEVSA
jgi:hypothetical protein